MSTSKGVLRECINATIGFEPLAVATGIHTKSLMRMLDASGKPHAANLFAVLEQHRARTPRQSSRSQLNLAQASQSSRWNNEEKDGGWAAR